MTASINDKFTKASDGGTNYAAEATVSSTRTAGDQTLVCNSLAGWPIDTAVHFSTFRLKADGSVDAASQTDWKGVVDGNSITELVRIAGAADSGNFAGDKVVINPTAGYNNDLIAGILKEHNQDGTHKDLSAYVSTEGILENGIRFSTVDIGEGATLPEGVLLYGCYGS